MNFFSCDSRVSDSETVKIIKLQFGESKNHPVKLSQIVDTTIYIEMDGATTIGSIDEVICLNDTIFLCDKQFGRIYMCDASGNFLNVFNKRGRASNEYLFIHDFDVDPITRTIHIYDGAKHVFQTYSMNGDFLSQIRIEDVVRDFKVLSNGEYLIYTPDYNKGTRRGLWKIDNKGRCSEHLLNISDSFRYGGLYPQYLHRIDDYTIGLMSGEDKDGIYHITSDSIIKKYELHFGMSIPKSIQKTDGFLDFERYGGEIYTKRDYFENSQWMSFSATNFKDNLVCFYNKINDEYFCIANEKDLIQDVDILGSFVFYDRNIAIGILYPHIILEYPILKDRFPNITMNSNPILVYTKLK